MQENGGIKRLITITARSGAGVSTAVSRFNLVFPGYKYVEGSFESLQEAVLKNRGDGLVICSPIAHLVTHEAFRVSLECPRRVRVERKFGMVTDDSMLKLRLLDEADDLLSHKYNPQNVMTGFDLVIDTSRTPQWETARALVNGYRDWLQERASKIIRSFRMVA